MAKKEDKSRRNLVNFIKTEDGGINKEKVIKIGGLTLGLLGGMFSSDLFAARSHTNTMDMVFDPTAPGTEGAHTNSVTWSWSNHSDGACCV